MFPILALGPFSIQTPQLILLLGIILGTLLSEKYLSATSGIVPRQLSKLMNTSLLVGLVAARLTYALQNPDLFRENMLLVIYPRLDLLNIEAGILAAMLTGLIIGQQGHLPLWPALDALIPLLAVTMVAVALSNAASGDAFGTSTQMPWGVELWGARRHPVQLYEALAAGIILFLTWPRVWRKAPLGARFLWSVTLTAFSRLFFEAFRAQGTFLFQALRTAQVAAFLIMALSLYLLSKRDHAERMDENA